MVFKKGQVAWNKGKKCLWTTKRNLENNPMKNPDTIKKMVESSDFRVNVKTRRERGSYNFTKQHKKKLSIANIGIHNSVNTELKKGHKLWDNAEYRKKVLRAIRKGTKPTKLEKMVNDLIQQNNLPFDYVGNGKIWFRGEKNSFNPDFLSKNSKHIIEIFGDYWHSSQKAKERDKERIATYSKYGYKTLVIWEYELVTRRKKNLTEQEILNKIKSFLYK